ncbi:MAG: DUF4469 domain-containing protein [Bacteroidales bacterium]|jgi:hypothetical protein|nr:DUF4469 domain-containing protein [Bacteroidales bacterium]
MSTLTAIAHPNELTKDVKNDYYLVPTVLGTLYHADIIKRLEAKQIATKNVNGDAFAKAYLNEVVLAAGEGYHVVTDAFHASTVINGAVYEQDLGHNIPADRLELRINFVQSQQARESLKDITVHVQEQPAPSGPVIQNVTNPVKNIPNRLDCGAMALLQGLRMAVRGDLTDEIGVTFTPVIGGADVRIAADQMSPNSPAKVQFVLPPAVTPGEWRVKISTQGTTNRTYTVKEVRTFEYPYIVTVM